MFALAIAALLLTQTRASILALLVATTYLFSKHYRKRLVAVLLIGLLMLGLLSTTRQIRNLSALQQLTSDRIYLWQLSQRGI